MVDRYTKVILTVIAASLVALVFKGGPVEKALAQGTGPVHVFIDGVQGFAFQFAGPLEVKAR